MRKKEIMRTTLAGAIIMNLILLPLTALAQDYPGYIGPGSNDYLNKRISHGYHIETFMKSDARVKQRINNLNHIQGIVSSSTQANIDSANKILNNSYQRANNSQELNWTIKQNQGRTEQTAANLVKGFKHITYSDGKRVGFQKGLPSSIQHERVVDEFGNLGYRDTDNMQYENYLLTGYDAKVTDHLGNPTYENVSGIKYTADSVFYGNYSTNANRHEIEKHIKTTDPTGNVKIIHWKTADRKYKGKFLKAFEQRIQDATYGNNSFERFNIQYVDNNPRQILSYQERGITAESLEYYLERKDTTYNNKDLVTGYNEHITTHLDTGNIETDNSARFRYLPVSHQFGPDVEESDPDRLLEAIINTSVQNPNGSQETNKKTTTYQYNSNQTLIAASGEIEINGIEASTFDSKTNSINPGHEYEGKTKLQYDPNMLRSGILMISSESNTNNPITYYLDKDHKEIIRIEESNATYTNKFINNLPRRWLKDTFLEIMNYSNVDSDIAPGLLTPESTTKDITTEFYYDTKGNLTGAQGTGNGWGYELTGQGWQYWDSDILIPYEIRLGEAKEGDYTESKISQPQKRGEL